MGHTNRTYSIVFDEEVVAKWKAEALAAPDVDISEKMVNYVSHLAPPSCIYSHYLVFNMDTKMGRAEILTGLSQVFILNDIATFNALGTYLTYQSASPSFGTSQSYSAAPIWWRLLTASSNQIPSSPRTFTNLFSKPLSRSRAFPKNTKIGIQALTSRCSTLFILHSFH